VSRRDETPPARRLPGFEREENSLPANLQVTYEDRHGLGYATADRRSANPTRWEAQKTDRPAFDGEGYNPEFDYERLSRQLRYVYLVMKDGRKRTIGEVVDAVGGGSETGVAAAMRALRQPRNGGHQLKKQRRGDPKKGLWEYWIEK
jgi:hypothetical protein